MSFHPIHSLNIQKLWNAGDPGLAKHMKGVTHGQASSSRWSNITSYDKTSARIEIKLKNNQTAMVACSIIEPKANVYTAKDLELGFFERRRVCILKVTDLEGKDHYVKVKINSLTDRLGLDPIQTSELKTLLKQQNEIRTTIHRLSGNIFQASVDNDHITEINEFKVDQQNKAICEKLQADLNRKTQSISNIFNFRIDTSLNADANVQPPNLVPSQPEAQENTPPPADLEPIEYQVHFEEEEEEEEEEPLPQPASPAPSPSPSPPPFSLPPPPRPALDTTAFHLEEAREDQLALKSGANVIFGNQKVEQQAPVEGPKRQKKKRAGSRSLEKTKGSRHRSAELSPQRKKNSSRRHSLSDLPASKAITQEKPINPLQPKAQAPTSQETQSPQEAQASQQPRQEAPTSKVNRLSEAETAPHEAELHTRAHDAPSHPPPLSALSHSTPPPTTTTSESKQPSQALNKQQLSFLKWFKQNTDANQNAPIAFRAIHKAAEKLAQEATPLLKKHAQGITGGWLRGTGKSRVQDSLDRMAIAAKQKPADAATMQTELKKLLTEIEEVLVQEGQGTRNDRPEDFWDDLRQRPVLAEKEQSYSPNHHSPKNFLEILRKELRDLSPLLHGFGPTGLMTSTPKTSFQSIKLQLAARLQETRTLSLDAFLDKVIGEKGRAHIWIHQQFTEMYALAQVLSQQPILTNDQTLQNILQTFPKQLQNLVEAQETSGIQKAYSALMATSTELVNIDTKGESQEVSYLLKEIQKHQSQATRHMKCLEYLELPVVDNPHMTKNLLHLETHFETLKTLAQQKLNDTNTTERIAKVRLNATLGIIQTNIDKLLTIDVRDQVDVQEMRRSYSQLRKGVDLLPKKLPYLTSEEMGKKAAELNQRLVDISQKLADISVAIDALGNRVASQASTKTSSKSTAVKAAVLAGTLFTLGIVFVSQKVLNAAGAHPSEKGILLGNPSTVCSLTPPGKAYPLIASIRSAAETALPILGAGLVHAKEAVQSGLLTAATSAVQGFNYLDLHVKSIASIDISLTGAMPRGIREAEAMRRFYNREFNTLSETREEATLHETPKTKQKEMENKHKQLLRKEKHKMKKTKSAQKPIDSKTTDSKAADSEKAPYTRQEPPSFKDFDDEGTLDLDLDQ